MTSRVSSERTLCVKNRIQLLFLSSFLADEHAAGTPSAVEVVRSDEGEELKGNFAKLCRGHNIRQEFTTVGSVKFYGVSEHHMVMVESAGLAAQVQVSHFSVGSKIRLVADYGLNVTIGRATRSAVRQLVLMSGMKRRSKCVLVRYHRARSFSSSQGT